MQKLEIQAFEKGFSADFLSKTGIQRPKYQVFKKLDPHFFLNIQRMGVKNTWFKFGKDLMTISVFKLRTQLHILPTSPENWRES